MGNEALKKQRMNLVKILDELANSIGNPENFREKLAKEMQGLKHTKRVAYRSLGKYGSITHVKGGSVGATYISDNGKIYNIELSRPGIISIEIRRYK